MELLPLDRDFDSMVDDAVLPHQTSYSMRLTSKCLMASVHASFVVQTFLELSLHSAENGLSDESNNDFVFVADGTMAVGAHLLVIRQLFVVEFAFAFAFALALALVAIDVAVEAADDRYCVVRIVVAAVDSVLAEALADNVHVQLKKLAVVIAAAVVLHIVLRQHKLLVFSRNH